MLNYRKMPAQAVNCGGNREPEAEVEVYVAERTHA